MSVSPRTQLCQSSRQPLDEASALQAISCVASAARNLESGLKDLAESALRIPGLHKIQLKPSVAFPPLEALEWYAIRKPVLCGSATACIEAGGRSWGVLCVHFEPRIETVESPLRFARFLGQQVASLLNRFALKGQRDAQLATIERLKRRLNTRIQVNRATHIVAKLRGTNEKEALIWLIQCARLSRCGLVSVADVIIYNKASFRKAAFPVIPRNELSVRANH
jgi:GAF domain-containing protein